MTRPTFTLRSPEDIRLVDADGKETQISVYDLMLMLEQGALVARLALATPKPKGKQ